MQNFTTLSKVINLEKAEKYILVFLVSDKRVHELKNNPEPDKKLHVPPTNHLYICMEVPLSPYPSSKQFIWTAITHSTTSLHPKGSNLISILCITIVKSAVKTTVFPLSGT